MSLNSQALLKNHFLIGKAIFVLLGSFLVSLFLGILLTILFVNIEDSYIYFLTILLHRSILLSNHIHVLLLPDNFSAAKRQLSYFCETSTTELENSDICKPRKRIPKRNYDSISENENNEYNQHSKTKNRGKYPNIKL